MTEPNAPSGEPQQQPQYPNAGGQYPGYGPGPYQGGPYGYPTGYYGQQASGTNGMAIASLVLGICGFLCVTPFVGLGLGIAAISRINKTGQSGKGMAIAGIILSSLWILLLVVSLAVGNVHFDFGNSSS